MNPYQVLGVSPNATDEEITSAWKRLARLSHPDMHPEATAEQRAVLTQRMAAINAAHQQLLDPATREQLRQSQSQSTPGSPPQRPQPRREGCDLCGSIPAAKFSYRQVTGLLLRDLIRDFDAKLCRSCSQAIGREMQSRTMVSGWWGVFAIFRNVGALLTNGQSLLRASRMKAPNFEANFPTNPLAPGASVFKRPRTWVGLGLVAAMVGLGINSAANQTSSANPTVGNCVSGVSSVSIVSCDGPHSGRIVREVTGVLLCPDSTEHYIRSGSRVFCIDDDG